MEIAPSVDLMQVKVLITFCQVRIADEESQQVKRRFTMVQRITVQEETMAPLPADGLLVVVWDVFEALIFPDYLPICISVTSGQSSCDLDVSYWLNAAFQCRICNRQP